MYTLSVCRQTLPKSSDVDVTLTAANGIFSIRICLALRLDLVRQHNVHVDPGQNVTDIPSGQRDEGLANHDVYVQRTAICSQRPSTSLTAREKDA